MPIKYDDLPVLVKNISVHLALLYNPEKLTTGS